MKPLATRSVICRFAVSCAVVVTPAVWAQGGVLPPSTPLERIAYSSVNAKLIQTAGDVRLNGKTIYAGTPVPVQGRLTTGINSTAQVQLADGSVVRMLPNSEMQLTLSRNYHAPAPNAATVEKKDSLVDWFAGRLRLVQGSIEAAVNKVTQRARPLEVETASSIIGVRGTEFRVATPALTAPHDRTEVLNGLIEAENQKNQRSVPVPKGKGVAFQPQMQVVDLLPPVALKADSGQLRAPFSMWQFPPLPNQNVYRVMVALDPKFESLVANEVVFQPAFDFRSFTHEHKTLYVRVRAIDPNGVEGFDATTRLHITTPYYLIESPSVYNQQGSTVLRWNPSSYAAKVTDNLPNKVIVSVFEDQQMQRVVVPTTLNEGNVVKLPLLPAGRYWLRVDQPQPGNTPLVRHTMLLDMPKHSGNDRPYEIPTIVETSFITE